jgi:hypothetical protein
MHIDRANQITVALETAGAADPISVLGLMFMLASGTLARGSSFGASEARDVSLFGFVGEIVDVFAILPQSHTLIMMSAVIPMADTMRIADEEGSDFVGDTEIDDFPGSFMTMVTNTSSGSLANFVLGPLQLLPATGILLATGLLFGKLSKLFVALMFERTDTTPCDDQGLLGIGGDCSQVDFSQVYRCLVLTRNVFRAFDFHAHMQFKASVPDQGTGTALFRKFERQDKGLAPFANWQDDPSLFAAHGLSRPFDGIEAFSAPRILHPHLWVGLAKLAGGFDIGKEGMDDHLNRLAMQSKAPFGGLLQFIAPRPVRVLCSRLFMPFHAAIPDLGRFHLSGFQSIKLASRQVFKSIHTHGFHVMMIPWRRTFCK